ncbi:UPF0301 protein BT_1078 [Durusdinium trenchii]|uniref:UPF0301 protein BT_1078 n=1 Tax=Durusdinium trenchii TaxID=1381693 RepID=A0ABP0H7C3_9DINO
MSCVRNQSLAKAKTCSVCNKPYSCAPPKESPLHRFKNWTSTNVKPAMILGPVFVTLPLMMIIQLILASLVFGLLTGFARTYFFTNAAAPRVPPRFNRPQQRQRPHELQVQRQDERQPEQQHEDEGEEEGEQLQQQQLEQQVRPPSPPQVQPGTMLYATQRMREGTFAGTTVLIERFDPATGATGIIVNKRLSSRHQRRDFMLGPQTWLGEGGPLAQSAVTVLHDLKSIPGSFELTPGIFLGHYASMRYLELEHRDHRNVKVLFGLAHWTKDQLERELAQDLWVVGPTQVRMATQSARSPATMLLEQEQEQWLPPIEPAHARRLEGLEAQVTKMRMQASQTHSQVEQQRALLSHVERLETEQVAANRTIAALQDKLGMLQHKLVVTGHVSADSASQAALKADQAALASKLESNQALLRTSLVERDSKLALSKAQALEGVVRQMAAELQGLRQASKAHDNDFSLTSKRTVENINRMHHILSEKEQTLSQKISQVQDHFDQADSMARDSGEHRIRLAEKKADMIKHTTDQRVAVAEAGLQRERRERVKAEQTLRQEMHSKFDGFESSLRQHENVLASTNSRFLKETKQAMLQQRGRLDNLEQRLKDSLGKLDVQISGSKSAMQAMEKQANTCLSAAKDQLQDLLKAEIKVRASMDEKTKQQLLEHRRNFDEQLSKISSRNQAKLQLFAAMLQDQDAALTSQDQRLSEAIQQQVAEVTQKQGQDHQHLSQVVGRLEEAVSNLETLLHRAQQDNQARHLALQTELNGQIAQFTHAFNLKLSELDQRTSARLDDVSVRFNATAEQERNARKHHLDGLRQQLAQELTQVRTLVHQESSRLAQALSTVNADAQLAVTNADEKLRVVITETRHHLEHEIKQLSQIEVHHHEQLSQTLQDKALHLAKEHDALQQHVTGLQEELESAASLRAAKAAEKHKVVTATLEALASQVQAERDRAESQELDVNQRITKISAELETHLASCIKRLEESLDDKVEASRTRAMAYAEQKVAALRSLFKTSLEAETSTRMHDAAVTREELETGLGAQIKFHAEQASERLGIVKNKLQALVSHSDRLHTEVDAKVAGVLQRTEVASVLDSIVAQVEERHLRSVVSDVAALTGVHETSIAHLAREIDQKTRVVSRSFQKDLAVLERSLHDVAASTARNHRDLLDQVAVRGVLESICHQVAEAATHEVTEMPGAEATAPQSARHSSASEQSTARSFRSEGRPDGRKLSSRSKHHHGHHSGKSKKKSKKSKKSGKSSKKDKRSSQGDSQGRVLAEIAEDHSSNVDGAESNATVVSVSTPSHAQEQHRVRLSRQISNGFVGGKLSRQASGLSTTSFTSTELESLGTTQLCILLQELQILRFDERSFFEDQIDSALAELKNAMVARIQAEQEVNRYHAVEQGRGRPQHVCRGWFDLTVSSNDSQTKEQQEQQQQQASETGSSVSGVETNWLVCHNHVLIAFESELETSALQCLVLDEGLSVKLESLRFSDNSQELVLSHDRLNSRWAICSADRDMLLKLRDCVEHNRLDKHEAPQASLEATHRALLCRDDIYKRKRDLQDYTTKLVQQFSKVAASAKSPQGALDQHLVSLNSLQRLIDEFATFTMASSDSSLFDLARLAQHAPPSVDLAPTQAKGGETSPVARALVDENHRLRRRIQELEVIASFKR